MATSRSCVAVRVGRRVAARETNLVRAHAAGVQEESGVQLHAAAGPHVDFGHPAADAIRVELLVPGRVERVGEVNARAVAADLHHLRSAVQRLSRLARMRRATDDPAEPDGADLLRLEWVAHVVLDELAGPPAGDVQIPVVD